MCRCSYTHRASGVEGESGLLVLSAAGVAAGERSGPRRCTSVRPGIERRARCTRVGAEGSGVELIGSELVFAG